MDLYAFIGSLFSYYSADHLSTPHFMFLFHSLIYLATYTYFSFVSFSYPFTCPFTCPLLTHLLMHLLIHCVICPRARIPQPATCSCDAFTQAPPGPGVCLFVCLFVLFVLSNPTIIHVQTNPPWQNASTTRRTPGRDTAPYI